MAIRFPDDPKERIRLFHRLSKGESVDYVIEGSRYHVIPRGTVEHREMVERRRHVYEKFLQLGFWTRLRMWLNGTAPESGDWWSGMEAGVWRGGVRVDQATKTPDC